MYGLNDVKKSKIEEMQASLEARFQLNSESNPFYVSKEFLDKLVSDTSCNGLRFFMGYEDDSIKLIVHKAQSNEELQELNESMFNVIDGDFVILSPLQEDAPYPGTVLNEIDKKDNLLQSFKNLPATQKSYFRAFFVSKDSLNQISGGSGLKIYLGWGVGWGKNGGMEEGLQLIFWSSSVDQQSATETSCTAHNLYNLFLPLLPGGNTNTRPCPPYGGCNQ